MSERMTPEREAQWRKYFPHVQELFDEIDALRAELAEYNLTFDGEASLHGFIQGKILPSIPKVKDYIKSAIGEITKLRKELATANATIAARDAEIERLKR